MATFIGDKSQEYASELPATNFYPALKLVDFQKIYQFLEDQTEESILLQMEVDRAVVHAQLAPITQTTTQSLTELSQTLFNNQTTAESIYKIAVFSLTAANLIGSKMATDATKAAADRQEALTDKSMHLLNQYRNAIDNLLRQDSGYTFELI